MSRRTRILMAALALFVFLGAVMSGYLNSDATPRQKYQISVIVYGNNRDRWAFLREGLNQGASELPVELSFSAMAQEADPQEQIRVVNQEIRNGADGILLAACDSTALNQTVAEAAGQVPVLMLETDVEDNAKTLGCLAADDYEMGKALGEFVKETYPGRTVSLIDEFTERSSVSRRQDGFLDAIGDSADVRRWQRGEGDYGLSLYIAKMYRQEGRGTVVTALDATSLEAVLDAFEKLEAEGGTNMAGHETFGSWQPLYGIGATDKIVYYLDQGWISGIVFPNEFRIGYAGLNRMVDTLERQPGAGTDADPAMTTEFYRADRKTIYEPDLQRLLFPIVQ